jgi:hypothetical protein
MKKGGGGCARLHNVPALSADIDVVDGGSGRHTGRAFLDFEYMGSVLKGATELSRVDGQTQAGVDVGVDDGILRKRSE